MEKCIFCTNTQRLTIIGLALGMGGFDYPVCGSCIKTKTILQLLVMAKNLMDTNFQNI